MKKNFEDSGLLPVKWVLGEIVEDNGALKIEWNDPKHGKTLKTEQQCAMLERSARDMLLHHHESVEPEWTPEVHAKWRDLHYNAELGLSKIQEEKQKRGMTLDTEHKLVIR